MGATEELIRSVAQWAIEVGLRAAQFPSEPARAAFLAERHHEIMEEARRSGMSERDALMLAHSCTEGAEKIIAGAVSSRDADAGRASIACRHD